MTAPEAPVCEYVNVSASGSLAVKLNVKEEFSLTVWFVGKVDVGVRLTLLTVIVIVCDVLKPPASAAFNVTE